MRKLAGLLLFCAVAAPPVWSQGCSQCRETVGQAPQATQQAYRRGITVLVLAATTVFTGAFLAIRRFR